MATKSLTYRVVPAAHALERILERNADIPTISWQVSPSGELTGHVAGTDSRTVFVAWRDALELEDEAGPLPRSVSRGEVLGVHVTMSMAAARTDVHHLPGGDRRLGPRARTNGLVVPLLSPRQPDRQRPGPMQAP